MMVGTFFGGVRVKLPSAIYTEEGEEATIASK